MMLPLVHTLLCFVFFGLLCYFGGRAVLKRELARRVLADAEREKAYTEQAVLNGIRDNARLLRNDVSALRRDFEAFKNESKKDAQP
jgi:hypothetical protein